MEERSCAGCLGPVYRHVDHPDKWWCPLCDTLEDDEVVESRMPEVVELPPSNPRVLVIPYNTFLGFIICVSAILAVILYVFMK